jgi:hypothetical protein
VLALEETPEKSPHLGKCRALLRDIILVRKSFGDTNAQACFGLFVSTKEKLFITFTSGVTIIIFTHF